MVLFGTQKVRNSCVLFYVNGMKTMGALEHLLRLETKQNCNRVRLETGKTKRKIAPCAIFPCFRTVSVSFFRRFIILPRFETHTAPTACAARPPSCLLAGVLLLLNSFLVARQTGQTVCGKM